MTPIKAIETRYKGCRFRSRLEARWAVFYDALGLRWDYEPQGFSLPSGPYLPDFFIHDINAWVEIKPAEPTPRENILASELCAASRQRVYVFCDGIYLPGSRNTWAPTAEMTGWDEWGETDEHGCDGELYGDSGYWWCQCAACGRFGIHYEGRSDRLPCKSQQAVPSPCPKESRWGDSYGPGGGPASPRLLSAYQAALSARFEHGETPR